MFWILLVLLILSSCRTYEPMAPGPVDTPPPSKTQSLRLEVIPRRLLMAPGVVDYVYVTVLDGEGNPLPDKEVRAVMDNPAVATLDKELKFTDSNGKAVFTLTGIAFPELTTLTLYTVGMSYTIEVDAFSPSISLLWSPHPISNSEFGIRNVAFPLTRIAEFKIIPHSAFPHSTFQPHSTF